MDDITAFMNGRNKKLVETEEKVLKKLKGEVEEKGLKLSNTEGAKEGKRKVITSWKYSEEKFQECSKKKEWSGRRVLDAGCGSENESQTFGRRRMLESADAKKRWSSRTQWRVKQSRNSGRLCNESVCLCLP